MRENAPAIITNLSRILTVLYIRGCYISAHVFFFWYLLNVLRLWHSDKMQGLSGFFFISFCTEFSKFNNTEARMLDFIYHINRKLRWNRARARVCVCARALKILPPYERRYYGHQCIFLYEKLCRTLSTAMF